MYLLKLHNITTYEKTIKYIIKHFCIWFIRFCYWRLPYIINRLIYMRNPKEIFNYNKLTRKQIELLDNQYLKYENKKNPRT